MKPSWQDIERERTGGEAAPELHFNHIVKVLERIGETPDGKLLREWLLEAQLLRPVARGLDESALRDIVAEKRFAHRLYELLEPHGAATDERKQRSSGRQQRPAAGGRVRPATGY